MENVMEILDKKPIGKLSISKESSDLGHHVLGRLKLLFPQKMSTIYKNEEELNKAAMIWSIALKNVTMEVISRALENSIDKFTWPPDIAEFKKLAMSYQGSSHIPWSEEVLTKKDKKNTMSNMELKRTIDDGAEVCKKLKKIYPEKSWMKISYVFSDLKKRTKSFYPGCSNLELIRNLNKYTEQDIVEALSVNKD